jgi:hypothetical protein
MCVSSATSASVYVSLTISKAKVLKMDIGIWVKLPGRLDELVHKLGILFTTDTLLLQTQIQFVVQKLLVVRATVQDYWKCPVGMDTGAERCENQLGDGDEDAADTLITDAEDFFSICGCVSFVQY